MSRNPIVVTARWTSTAVLAASLVWFAASSIHWPLVGDASLMHYVVFLMDHGMAPYREIGDMNFPGAYLPDWLVVHALGRSALAWRLYDLGLLVAGGGAMMLLARPASWTSGFWAAALFALIHGRDGLYQTGQRDLTLAVLLLLGTVVLLRSGLRCSTWNMIVFGFSVGLSTTIKPVALPFLLLPVPLLWAMRRSKEQGAPAMARLGIAGVLGSATPLMVAALWLHHHRALGAFVHVEQTLAMFHAGLGRRSLAYLLQHSLAPLVPVAGAWLVLLLVDQWTGLEKDPGSTRRHTLLLGSLLGCAAYVLQGRGYPYHRYALLGFLLPLLAHDLDRMMSVAQNRWIRHAATIAVLLAAALIGGVSAVVISRLDRGNPEFREELQADLSGVAGADGLPSLSGKVQCLDTVFGCIDTLNRLNLLQTTGTLYDEFLFHAAGAPAVDQSRARFWQAIEGNPARIFVITDPLFPTGPDHYCKLEAWPAFAAWLDAHYRLAVERPAMRRVRTGGAAFNPPGYRVYVRR